MVVDSNQAPDTPRPNQPAAQPPAVVEQGAQLPAKTKAKRKTPRKNPRHRIPEDWEPKAETMAGLVFKQGIPREFCDALIWEFRIYWTDRGDARPGWDATFVRHAKDQWKREQENEQRAQANQKYRDASGRPISEREYVSRELTKDVLADLDSGVLEGIDLDTKF